MEDKNEFGFFYGLMFIGYIYVIGWVLYTWGYSRGADSAMGEVYQAASKLQHCNKVLVGDK
jgi:hypothetical protein